MHFVAKWSTIFIEISHLDVHPALCIIIISAAFVSLGPHGAIDVDCRVLGGNTFVVLYSKNYTKLQLTSWQLIDILTVSQFIFYKTHVRVIIFYRNFRNFWEFGTLLCPDNLT